LKLSVITDAWKSEATVGEAIASVAGQTHADLEHLIIEGNSGGVSNRNLAKIRQKMAEDMLAIRRNRVGGLHTLALKNLSKVGQFLVRPPHRG
jgi:glycosyltransferase involved in cell wall biosynthesis